MLKTGLVCAVAVTACLFAQDASPALADLAAANDAISWAAGLREPMRRMTNPVVTAYGIASLAALICPADKGVGSDLFHEALTDLNNLPGNVFQDSRRALPVATFSGMWKMVVGPGLKCDPTLPPPSDNARQRRELERREASAFLAQAKFTDDYERAAQLAQAALEAGDANQVDVTPVTTFLIQFRDPAPDLADDVFQRAIGFVTAAEIPNIRTLADLGNYLFLDAALKRGSEPIVNRTNYSVNGSTFALWNSDHENVNPDMVAAYIGAVADVLARQDYSAIDPVAAYAAAYQLLPKARDLELDEADRLQKAVDQMQAQNAGVAGAVEAKLGAQGGTGAGQSNFARLMALIRAAMNAGKFTQARDLLREVDGVSTRSRIAAIIDFNEAAYATRGKDSDRALQLAGGLAGGVKLGLLFAGILATSPDPVTALSALHLGVKDAELLSYEQRMALLPALGAACMKVDAEESLSVLRQIIGAYNDANVSPRKARFAPWDTGVFDGRRIVFGPAGFTEVIHTGTRQQSFSLKAPGVTAFSLEAFIAQAKDLDFPQLAAAIGELHNELQLTKGYLALAGLRLKVAKVSTKPAR